MKRLAAFTQQISHNDDSNQEFLTLKPEAIGKVGVIWFNKHESLNSLSSRMAEEFAILFKRFDSQPQIKLIIIRSKHKKAFCAGADIKGMFLSDHVSNSQYKLILLERAFLSTRKPIISVVQGMALGGGFEIALLSDMIVCSDKATFGLPEINLGIFPGMGGTQKLPRLAGTKAAYQAILSGTPIPATKIAQMNIAECWPSEQFEQRLAKFIEVLVSKASDSLQYAKHAIRLSQSTSLQQGLNYEATLIQSLFGKQCVREGLSAFKAKRTPNFKNM